MPTMSNLPEPEPGHHRTATAHLDYETLGEGWFGSDQCPIENDKRQFICHHFARSFLQVAKVYPISDAKVKTVMEALPVTGDHQRRSFQIKARSS